MQKPTTDKPVTTAVYGKPFGFAPHGPQEPLHRSIFAKFFNIQARIAPAWDALVKYHKAVLPLPNPAPVGMSFSAASSRAVNPQARELFPVHSSVVSYGGFQTGAEGTPVLPRVE